MEGQSESLVATTARRAAFLEEEGTIAFLSAETLGSFRFEAPELRLDLRLLVLGSSTEAGDALPERVLDVRVRNFDKGSSSELDSAFFVPSVSAVLLELFAAPCASFDSVDLSVVDCTLLFLLAWSAMAVH